ncbi:hypothetical protein [Arsenophonus nasoniae]|uniref:Uncharacterized protein n=1 Tax=Arsenophonus nasoniae TaxID=638 RepID=A0AA95GBU8_9GAMM|nr:hypothetical protein [Arsenophonus nasoniae]WGL95802.1 hypothetical protein QE207_04130 [Arsenophonus nasoniae]
MVKGIYMHYYLNMPSEFNEQLKQQVAHKMATETIIKVGESVKKLIAKHEIEFLESDGMEKFFDTLLFSALQNLIINKHHDESRRVIH